ncbi:hypothetical protein KFU94_63325 [Chloroflexi bacterium TSY]|nr:hypothetical protein [Chloroflexi bacterium TSY]
MINKRQHRRTHLFTVRLWIEQIDEDCAEARGRVQHVLNGDVCYFRTWRELTTFFDRMLQELEGPYAIQGGDNDQQGINDMDRSILR